MAIAPPVPGAVLAAFIPAVPAALAVKPAGLIDDRDTAAYLPDQPA